MDLIPRGGDVEVTSQNVYDYVRRYAQYRMFKCQQKALDVSVFWLKLNVWELG